jgi:hypothetical protein
MILRKFSADGKRISLVVNGRRVDNAGLKHQCYGDYLYGEDNILERAFGDEEAAVSSLLADLSATRLSSLNAEDIRRLQHFVGHQHSRTPAAAEHLSSFGELHAKALLRDRISREKDAPFRLEDLDRVRIRPKHPQGEAIWKALRTMPAYRDLAVKFVSTDCTPGFIISDHPVVAYNQFAEQHARFSGFPCSTGLVQKGLQLFLPLSPGMTVALYDATVYRYGGLSDVCKAGPDDVAMLNGCQAINAQKCFYFHPGRMTDAALADLNAARARHPSLFAKKQVKGRTTLADGRRASTLLTYHPEIRLGTRLHFIMVLDKGLYADHPGPFVPARSRELVDLLEAYEEFLERKAGKNDEEDAEDGD